MEHVLSVYNSNTKEIVYMNQSNLEPQKMFEDWFFSQDCNVPIEEIENSEVFYYSISEQFDERKAGFVNFKKNIEGKFDATLKETNLFFEHYCPCCGETYSVGCLEVKTSMIDRKITYVAYDFDDEDYEETIIVPFNPFEFSFLGFNPWLPNDIDFEVDEIEKKLISYIDSNGKDYTHQEVEQLKELYVSCVCKCGNKFETSGYDIITGKVTSCGKCDKNTEK